MPKILVIFMEEKIKEIRGIILNIFIFMFIIYAIILIYIYPQNCIPYSIYFIKTGVQRILALLGIALVLLYTPGLRTITYDLFKKIYPSIKSFSLGQKFVLIAIILLICSAVSLIKNNEKFANAIAILSYYFLTFGVFNEFLDYILEKKINDKINIAKTSVFLILLGIAVHYTSDVKYYFKYLDILFFMVALAYLGIKLKTIKKSEEEVI
jgi:hypothetical protein